MKITNKQLLFPYVTAAFFFTIYTLISIKDCEAYWMHDASITITKRKLLADNFYLFFLPIFIILVQRFFKIASSLKLLLTQFIVSLSAMLLLFFAINKPCEEVDNGHYMFISAGMIVGYYILGLVAVVLTGIIIIRTIILKKKSIRSRQG